MTVTLLLVVSIVLEIALLALFLACYWRPLRTMKRIQETRAKQAILRCDICLKRLEDEAVRTHNGHWRCKEHKAA